MFKCSVCGYIHDGTEAPAACPKCGAPAEKFVALEAEERNLVEKSRLTNGLHMHLLGLYEKIEFIAVDGIEDNLDPAFVKIFERARKDAQELRASIKAELAGHMSKKKWG